MKFNKYLVWAITFLPILATVGSGLAKISGAAPVVETLTKLGVGSVIVPLGIAEIVFAIMYLIPRTMSFGFFLLCSYFGGAIATDLSHGGAPVVPIVVLTLFWLATFMQKPNWFLGKEV
jgi:hypothetical protein